MFVRILIFSIFINFGLSFSNDGFESSRHSLNLGYWVEDRGELIDSVPVAKLMLKFGYEYMFQNGISIFVGLSGKSNFEKILVKDNNVEKSYIISQVFASFFEIGYYRKLYKNLEARAHISPGMILASAHAISDNMVGSINIVPGANVGLTLNYTHRVNKWFGISPYAGVSITIPLRNTEMSLTQYSYPLEEEDIIHELESYYNYEIGLSFLIM
jgi:hypothetical protein